MMKENFKFENKRDNWKDNPNLIDPISKFLGSLLPNLKNKPINVLRVESEYEGDRIVKIHAVIDSEGQGNDTDFYLESDALEEFKKQNKIK